MYISLEKWLGKKVWVEIKHVVAISSRPTEIEIENAKPIVVKGKETKPMKKVWYADLMLSNKLTMSIPFDSEEKAVTFLKDNIVNR